MYALAPRKWGGTGSFRFCHPGSTLHYRCGLHGPNTSTRSVRSSCGGGTEQPGRFDGGADRIFGAIGFNSFTRRRSHRAASTGGQAHFSRNRTIC